MNGNTSDFEGANIDWDTEDELEIENFSLPCSPNLEVSHGESALGSREAFNSASSSASSSNSKLFDRLVGMHFYEKLVAKAIQEDGDGNEDSLVVTLLTYTALENSSEEQQNIEPNHISSDHEESFLDDFSDEENLSDSEDMRNPISDEEKTMMHLVQMGYTIERPH